DLDEHSGAANSDQYTDPDEHSGAANSDSNTDPDIYSNATNPPVDIRQCNASVQPEQHDQPVGKLGMASGYTYRSQTEPCPDTITIAWRWSNHPDLVDRRAFNWFR